MVVLYFVLCIWSFRKSPREERGCVGNASRTLFRFGACAFEFVEDRVC